MKRIFAFLLLLSFLVTPLPVAFASDLSGADIYEDLKDVDLTGFTETTLITMAETGFIEAGKNNDTLNVLLYVYNASGEALSKGELDNTALIATKINSFGEATEFTKFNLRYVSSTPDELIYKFKVVDPDHLLPILTDKMIDDMQPRRYDIVSIQLKEADGVKDYKIGMKYTFLGNEKEGLSMSKQTVLELDVYPVYYRTESSALSTSYEQHRNQVNSVYFSVPEKCFEDGYTLKAITADWYEYKTRPIMVLEDETVVNTLKPYLHRDIGEYTSEIPYEFHYGFRPYWFNTVRSSWGYNCDGIYDITPHSFDTRSTELNWLFWTKGASFADYVLSTEDLIEYALDYTNTNKYVHSGYVPSAHGDLSADLFTDNVDPGRTMGYNLKTVRAEDTFDLLNYADTHDFWDTWADYGLLTAIFGSASGPSRFDFSPIQALKAQDMRDLITSSGLSIVGNEIYDYLSSELLIDKSFVPDFVSFINEAEENGDVGVLFRFGVTDYMSNALDRSEYDKDKHPAGYVAQETVFLNFDVIELEFDNGEQTVIYPVVNDPVDVISPIEPPLLVLSDLSWWVYALCGLVACFVVLAIVKVAKR